MDEEHKENFLTNYKGDHIGLSLLKAIRAIKTAQYKDAFITLKPLVDKYPVKLGAQLARCRLNMAVGHYQLVEETLNRLLRYVPQSDGCREMIVACYLMQGKTTLAKKFVDLHNKKYGPSAALSVLEAKVLRGTGRIEEAIEILLPATETSGEISLILAELYLMKYAYTRAENFARAALEIKHSQKQAIRLLSIPMLMNGQWEEVRDLLQAAMDPEDDPEDEETLSAHYRELKLLNEFSTDLVGARSLLQLLHIPDTTSLVYAEKLLENSSYLGIHFFYLNALRQEGRLDRINSVTKSRIPKTIVQFWHSAQLPTPLQKCTASWMEKNPAYTYHLYSEESARQFLVEHFSDKVVSAYNRCKVIAEKSDLFRLAYLYKCGGIYADIDDLCLQQLDDLLDQGSGFIVYQEGLALGNNFIAVASGHDIIKSALDMCVRNLSEYVVEPSWYKTGPVLLTEEVTKYLALQQTQGKKLVELTILGQSEFRQFVLPHLPLSYKRTGGGWVQQNYAFERF